MEIVAEVFFKRVRRNYLISGCFYFIFNFMQGMCKWTIYFTILFRFWRLWKFMFNVTIDWLSIFDSYFLVNFYIFLYRLLHLLWERKSGITWITDHSFLFRSPENLNVMTNDRLWHYNNYCFLQSQALRLLKITAPTALIPFPNERHI